MQRLFHLTVYLLSLWNWGDSLFAQSVKPFDLGGNPPRLRYFSDAENNYIPDFSQVGYKNGDMPIPEVPVVKTISALSGDNTAHINQALKDIAALPPDSLGLRGALLLLPGRYEIHGSILIPESGMVLRGVGSAFHPDSNTILLAIGNTPEARVVVQAGYGTNVGWNAPFPAIRTPVTGTFIPAGSRCISVAKPSIFKPGDQVILHQVSTQAWLQRIDFGATDVDAPWKTGEIDLYYNRYIRQVYPEEGKIELDIPIYDHLEPTLAPSEVYILYSPGVKKNIGIENLRIDIQTKGVEDEAHALSALKFYGVEDCWARNVTALHFTYAGIDMELATRVSVTQCAALEPHSMITGERRYNFAVGSRTNNILFADCQATEGRHSFVSNGASSVSGIVFHQCTSSRDHNSSEGHRRWSQALLYDNIEFRNTQSEIPLALYNRGSHGTGHGWSSVHSVAWNVQIPPNKRIVLQKPPFRQNYAIGCRGVVSNDYLFFQPPGYIEGTNAAPIPSSLYLAQREDRLKLGVPPDAPARLQVFSSGNAGEITLQWLDIAANEDGYRVERSDDQGSTYYSIAEFPPNTTSCQLPDGNKSWYRVVAFHKGKAESAASNPVQATVATPTSTLQKSDWLVYPNPATHFLYIQSMDPVRQIELFDGQGKRLLLNSQDDGLEYVFLPSILPGTYFLKSWHQSGATGVKQLVVNY